MLHSGWSLPSDGEKDYRHLLDNVTSSCINNLQMEHGMDSYFTEFRFHQQESGRQEGSLSQSILLASLKDMAVNYRVTTIEQLHEALGRCRKQTVSTLIDIKSASQNVVHKYLSWWRVGGAQVSRSEQYPGGSAYVGNISDRPAAVLINLPSFRLQKVWLLFCNLNDRVNALFAFQNGKIKRSVFAVDAFLCGLNYYS